MPRILALYLYIKSMAEPLNEKINPQQEGAE